MQRLKHILTNPTLLKSLFIFFSVIKWIIILFIIGGLFVGGAAFGYVSALVKDDPVRSKQFIADKMNENSETGFVYFNDATVVGQLRSEEDRRLAAYSEIPQLVKDATISVEDRTFFEHPGIDLKGTFRAVKQKLLKENVQTGGSTITQQLARRVFLSLDKTDSRKIKEIFLSLRLERILSKPEILVNYLNKIPYGNGSVGYNLFGIKAAAKGIFNIDNLEKLNIPQAAYLAGLPQLPSTYSAFTSKGTFDPEAFKLAKERQKLVLKSMLDDNKISDSEYQSALAFDIQGSLAAPSKKAYDTYPFLMLETERRAEEIMVHMQNPQISIEDLQKDENSELMKEAHLHLLTGGYKIYTTIDKTIYDSMHAISENSKNFTPDVKEKGVEQLGGIMIDNKTGAILGMIEGRDFNIQQMNHATQMHRQPGSTMKPIAAYLPAIEKGVIQPASVIDDVPQILKDGSQGYKIPENWDNQYHGLITARVALNRSYNVPAIRVFLEKVGIKNAWEFARKLGITTLTPEDDNAQTGVIGGLTQGVSVEELTNAYSAIGNKGVFNDAFLISKIEDPSGKVIFEQESKPVAVVSDESAYLMTDMLRTVISDPGGTAADMKTKFKHYSKIPIVGKTGSTQNDVDAWFMGYTPDITFGVWVGYDIPATLVKGQGTLRAKNIWALVMDDTIDKKPELFPTLKFTKPDKIVEMTVSNLSGLLPSDLTSQTNHQVTDIFNKDNIPTVEDNTLVNMNVVVYNSLTYVPNENTPLDMVQQKVVIKREKSITEILKEVETALGKIKASKKPRHKDGSLYTAKDYIPLNSDQDAPSEIDPRKDDGSSPNPPSEVVLNEANGHAEITFKGSDSPDVVGYRIYRSLDNGPFQKLNTVILSGQDTKFTEEVSPTHQFSYYFSSVDVVGNESAQSAIVHTGTSQFDQPPVDPNLTPDLNTTTTAAPSTPTNITIAKYQAGIKMTWKLNPSSDQIVHYIVYYSAVETGKYNKIGMTTSPQFVYVQFPISGWYRVSAVNTTGESASSKSVQFKE